MIARWLVFVLVCFTVLSCGSSKFDGSDEPPKTGTLAAALQTTTGGATYRFVTGTELTINAVGPGVGGESYTVDGPETTFEKKLGPGNYVLGLVFPGFTTPHLSRTGSDGITTIVEATWTDAPQPLPFSIVADTTTAVTLHFTVPGFGDVTFSAGTLSVDVSVANEIHTKPSSFLVTATVLPTSVNYDGGFSDDMSTYVASGTPVHATLVVAPQTGSSWMLDVESACIDVDVVDTSAAAGETAFDLRLEQVEGGTGRLCIRDQGASDWFSLGLSQSGPAPADQQATLPGTYVRYVIVNGSIGDVFDGTTLKQGILGQGVTLSSGDFLHQLFDGGTQLTTLQGVVSTGTVTAKP